MPTIVSLPELWLPILVSAVVVFFLGFITHMVLPHHKADLRKADAQQDLMDLIRAKIKPGHYMFPLCDDWSELKDPAKKKWFDEGPHGLLRVWPCPVNWGRNLGLTFLVYLLVGFMVAYLGTQALDAGAEFMAVFRFTGAAAMMAYCVGVIPEGIWFRRGDKHSVLNTVADGVLFGLATGAIFGWMWPALTL